MKNSTLEKVSVNTNYTRSINIERDSDSLSIINSYIPTNRTLSTLKQISLSIFEEGKPKAWSLIGPYGSGKSAFAICLSSLLADPKSENSETVLKILNQSDQKLVKDIKKKKKDFKGFLTLTITGSPEPLINRLLEELIDKSKIIWTGNKGRTPKFIEKLNDFSNSEIGPTTTEFLNIVRDMNQALKKKGYLGLLLIVDELGKFLEYETRHQEINDIYILQLLAEETKRETGFKFSLCVLLHQSIDQYAKSLPEVQRNEWTKIQGRFESIPFIESPEEILRIINVAIKQNFSDEESRLLKDEIIKKINVLKDLGFVKNDEDKKLYQELFEGCYPLHPISALILPILCQKIAQNERTLFSYLGSKEYFGFSDRIHQITKIGEDWIYPSDIFEYFINNQNINISDPIIQRRWAEILNAIDRLGDASKDELDLLKVIGLLNIIGAHGHIKASSSILSICHSDRNLVDKTIKRLEKKSIIQHRKFNSEYRVWQGSDFDINEELNKEKQKFYSINISERINDRHNILPVVARKYSIENGTLRYFKVLFTDEDNYKSIPALSDHPRLILFLSNNKKNEAVFNYFKNNHGSILDILALCKDKDVLREAIIEVWALENIEINKQELNSDPIAQREFKDRYSYAIRKETELVDSIIDNPQSNQWYWKKELLYVPTKISFQYKLSEILNSVYRYSPLFKNELINREKISAQANAARTKLMSAMLNHESLEDLGFEKFPAEKSIYLSILKESKLHSKTKKNVWRFSSPKSPDPNNVKPVWQKIEQFLNDSKDSPRSLVDLNKELMSPPFGIKEGILPLLYFTVMLSKINEIAIYEDKIYTPYLSEEHIERFLRRPDTFQFQYFKIEGLNRSIYDAYNSVIGNIADEDNILSIARPIAKEISKLPDFTKNTVHLSEETKKIRDSFKFSQSPFDLFLIEIPKILGVDLKSLNSTGDNLKKFSRKLEYSLNELRIRYDKLKNEFSNLIATAFGFSKNLKLNELRSELSYFKGLENFTIDKEGQIIFLKRLNKEDVEDQIWLEDILSFLIKKHPKKWTDQEYSHAEYKLITYANKSKELNSLRNHYYEANSKNKSDDFDVYLLRGLKKGDTIEDDVDHAFIVKEISKKAVENQKNEILKILNNTDSDLKETLFAEVVFDYLTKKGDLKKEIDNSSELQETLEIKGNK